MRQLYRFPNNIFIIIIRPYNT